MLRKAKPVCFLGAKGRCIVLGVCAICNAERVCGTCGLGGGGWLWCCRAGAVLWWALGGVYLWQCAPIWVVLPEYGGEGGGVMVLYSRDACQGQVALEVPLELLVPDVVLEV